MNRMAHRFPASSSYFRVVVNAITIPVTKKVSYQKRMKPNTADLIFDRYLFFKTIP